MQKKLLVALCAAAAFSSSTFAADELKIGYVNTFSGPSGVLGQHYRDGFDLALEELGNKMGNLTVKVEYADDQLKPDISKSVVERLIERDKVDLVAGFNFSNVLLAAIDTTIKADKLLIGSNAGPSVLAGEQCHPNHFNVGQQNDGASEALGKYLAGQNVASVYAVTPNYQAGRDMVNGFKVGYGKDLVGEVYTQMGQTDFSTELSQIRAANPAAVFVFMPGGNGINFVKQWAQAGMMGRIPLYSIYTIDHATLKAIGSAAVGTMGVSQYVEDLDNPTNKKFVEDFVKKFGYKPSDAAAEAFDTANLINSAVVATNGNVSDKEAMRKALRKADFKSVRGDFSFNTNQQPIQNYYLRETVKLPDGSLGFVTKEVVATAYKDRYASLCKAITD